ncbi:MAG TPA: PQQ-binding-like beta-propeller repeat protein [Gemmataceae bacterium]|nr:PQQ-binding-like beta-propeller repeat protein [Gemmataceae bacterium]
MKHFLGAWVVWLVAGVTVEAQSRDRVYSRPQLPSQAVLNRLNLKMAWRAYVPTGGQRDRIFSVQFLENQMLVLMRSGQLTALDPETGTLQWNLQVGLPYWISQAPGYNNQSIFVYSGARLYSLNRKTGGVEWDLEPKYFPSAPPAADDRNIYLAGGTGQLSIYEIPKPPQKGLDVRASTRQDPESSPVYGPNAGGGRAGGEDAATVGGVLSSVGKKRLVQEAAIQPTHLWDYEMQGRLEQTPLLAENFLVLGDTRGTFISLTKTFHEIQYSFRTEAGISAPLNQHGTTAYIASREYNVFALDVVGGQILWRFTADRPILRRPAVTDEDVFVAPERGGLYRINRMTGAEIWRNQEAERYVASNKAFVYALDPSGRVLVLDRGRGTLLSALDARDFVVPVANEFTDRVYLASNDGLVICLHDSSYTKAMRVRTFEERKPQVEKKDEKLPDEDKGEKKKPEKGPLDKKDDKKEDKKPADNKDEKKPDKEK